jgi:hypothetical protein
VGHTQSLTSESIHGSLGIPSGAFFEVANVSGAASGSTCHGLKHHARCSDHQDRNDPQGIARSGTSLGVPQVPRADPGRERRPGYGFKIPVKPRLLLFSPAARGPVGPPPQETVLGIFGGHS